jgi:hypothetical protein
MVPVGHSDASLVRLRRNNNLCTHVRRPELVSREAEKYVKRAWIQIQRAFLSVIIIMHLEMFLGMNNSTMISCCCHN